MGSMINAGVYGQTIPVIYGLVKSPFLPIEAWNIRQGPSGKKGKKSGKKGAPPTYVENVDFLFGHNPILGVVGMWNNNVGRVGMEFRSETHIITGETSVTLTDPTAILILAVTLAVSNSGSFNDYGGPGTVTYSGYTDLPLWNSFVLGPDPTNPGLARYWPYLYRWNPSYGPTIYLDANPPGLNVPLLSGTLKIYYAAASHGHGTIPLKYYRLTFEDQLGNGHEFDSGAPPGRIIYPMYSGAGSPDFDLGATGLIPGVKGEMIGKFGTMPPYGDAEFPDIIEDVIKSGILQAGYSYGSPYSSLQHGVNCYDYPGIIERKYRSQVDPGINSFTFDQALPAGSVLVVFVSAATGTLSPGISDTALNTWTLLASGNNPNGDLAYAVWYTITTADYGPGDLVTAGVKPYQVQLTGISLAGLDTFDGVQVYTGGPTSDISLSAITTTNPGNQPAYLLAFVQSSSGEPSFGIPEATQWSPVLNEPLPVPTYSTILHRTVRFPGTYKIGGVNAGSGYWVAVFVSFKQQNPSSITKSLGNIVDADSMQLVRNQCRVFQLYGSLSMQSQKKASDWLTDLYFAANAAPVWSGFKLKSIPYSEQSNVGSGTVYVSPTASGPLADLDFDKGDFLSSPGTPPITVARSSQATDAPNIFQLQVNDRHNDYNQVVVSQPLAGATAIYGSRKDSPQTLDCVCDPTVARKLLMIKARRANLIRNTYKFRLDATKQLFEAMDLVTITDRKAGIVKVPIRFTAVTENEKYELDCEAEPFIYGLNAPDAVTGSSPVQNPPPYNQDPGGVNAPIIFQPVPRLLQNQGQPQVWIVVSGGGQYYGGCLAYLSTDGGSSYNVVGEIIGSAITGYTTNDWPAASDPDFTNSLAVDLSESNGELLSYSTTDEDNFVYPCYVAGGNAGIPYELMTYAVATLTATHKYTLQAGGSPVAHLRRAVFGAPSPGMGVHHALSGSPLIGARFCLLNPLGQGMVQLNLDPRWIGQTLHFKFCAFNAFGSQLQSLSDVVDYTYAPIVTGSGPSYVQAPPFALSQPDGAHLALAAVVETFESGPVDYSWSAPIAIPGGAPVSPTWLYVTVTDTAELGGVNLPVNIETTNAKVGVVGYTYLGAILALPAGGGTRVTPGGWPAPQGFQTGG